MYKRIVFSIFFFIQGFLFAQNEQNIWYFGQNAGIDFNSGSAVALLNGAMNTYEGCASISDNTGDLLFYTDGTSIWNANHTVMPNGTGLLGDASSTQSAIIVKKPGNNSIYYVFTVDEEVGPNGLNYSEVDMSFQGGLGDVNSNKNILIVNSTCEKICAIKHQNNIDFWVVTHLFGSNTYHSYLVSSSGINMTPIITNIGAVVNNNWTYSIGYLKASPNGNRIASVRWSMDNLEIYDFNKVSGVLSNTMNFSGFTGDGPYGVEFSPDGKLLYVSYDDSPSYIYQYNLSLSSNSAINSSRLIIGSNTGYGGALQIAPDGKIYHANTGNSFLGTINNPNTVGVGCNYIANGFSLNGAFSSFGLPTFVSTGNSTVSTPEPTEICEAVIKMPNVFSPNRDAYNKLFLPVKIECIEKADIVIYSRWGQEIYKSFDLLKGWNGGTTSGSEVPEGTYYWIINYYQEDGNQSNLKGFVTLLK